MSDKLRSDSPLSRGIVTAFLDFLRLVELAEEVDREGVDLAIECLEQAFKVNQSFSDDQIPYGSLPEIFEKYCSLDKPGRSTPTCTSETISKGNKLHTEAEPSDAGVTKDEIFGQFYAALDKNNYFASAPGGDEDPAQLAKATELFEEAIIDLERSGAVEISTHSLASSFKVLGNNAIHSKLYPRAVDLYTCGIALDEKNAVLYCNRAAAYTCLKNYEDAIDDCKRSLALNPSYTKAYSRLGLVYYEQGEYGSALTAFDKAMHLDPDNAAIKSNYEMARRRLLESRTVESRGQHSGEGVSWSIPISDLPVTSVRESEDGSTNFVVGGRINLFG